MNVLTSRPLRLALGAAICLGMLSACESPTTTSTSSSYASNYPADGFYNPHGGSGSSDSASLLPGNSYGQNIPPPPPGFESPEPASSPPPKKSTASTSSSSKPKSTPPPAKKPTSTASKSKSTPAKSTAKAKPAAKKPTSTVRSYTVKQGDTLWGIAQRMKSSVDRIKAYNGLKSDLMKPGMTLKVP